MGEVVLGRGQRADETHLAGAVGVRDHRAEPLAGAHPQDRGGGRADVGQDAQRTQVAVGDVRVIHEVEQLRFDQEQMGDPLSLDRGEGGSRLECALQDDRAAAEQGGVDQGLGQVGELAVGQLAARFGLGTAIILV